MLTGWFDGFSMTGELSKDAPAFLRHHGQQGVAEHVERVAGNARRIASRVGVEPEAAAAAAWMHDISQVVPFSDMVDLAMAQGVEVLPEEREVPALLHGKLSALFAEQFFGVHDPGVLGAIRCHSTLRPRAAILDKVLFVSDKLSWDLEHAPYITEMEEALGRSLDHAVWSFLQYARQKRYGHPLFLQAYEEFAGKAPGQGGARG